LRPSCEASRPTIAPASARRVETGGDEGLEIPCGLEEDDLLRLEPAEAERQGDAGASHVQVDALVPIAGNGHALAPAGGDAGQRQACACRRPRNLGEEEEVERSGLFLEQPLKGLGRHAVEVRALPDKVVSVQEHVLRRSDRVVDPVAKVGRPTAQCLRPFPDLRHPLPDETAEPFGLSRRPGKAKRERKGRGAEHGGTARHNPSPRRARY
jgi:hypothetical protein